MRLPSSIVAGKVRESAFEGNTKLFEKVNELKKPNSGGKRASVVRVGKGGVVKPGMEAILDYLKSDDAVPPPPPASPSVDKTPLHAARQRCEELNAELKAKSEEMDSTVESLNAELTVKSEEMKSTVESLNAELKAKGEEMDSTVESLNAELKAKGEEMDKTVEDMGNALTQLEARMDENNDSAANKLGSLQLDFEKAKEEHATVIEAKDELLKQI
ncbi:hypothetical protein TrVE_jg146, partial [Triparma verrucosa]